MTLTTDEISAGLVLSCTVLVLSGPSVPLPPQRNRFETTALSEDACNRSSKSASNCRKS